MHKIIFVILVLLSAVRLSADEGGPPSSETNASIEVNVIQVTLDVLNLHEENADKYINFEVKRLENGWLVYAWREPKVPGGFRLIEINSNGKVIKYELGK